MKKSYEKLQMNIFSLEESPMLADSGNLCCEGGSAEIGCPMDQASGCVWDGECLQDQATGCILEGYCISDIQVSM